MRRLSRGLTLVEVLISVALMSVIVLAITNTARNNIDLSLKLATRQNTVFSGQIAMDRLTKELQMAVDERIQKSDSQFKSAEASEGHELTFSFYDSPLRPLFQRRTAGIALSTYKLVKDPEATGSYMLVRKQVPIYEQKNLEDAYEEVIAKGVLEFNLEFYNARVGQWQDTWDDKGPATSNFFPKAVRIELVTVDTNSKREDWKKKSLKFRTSVLLLNELEEA